MKLHANVCSQWEWTKLRQLLVIVLLGLGIVSTYGQTKTVSGIVKSESGGEPLVGATVKVKETNTGGITDIDGRYTIQANLGQTLIVSYIGYRTKEVKVERTTRIDILLQEDNEMLDEVVVVGYGTMKRSDLTGSVVSVTGDELKKSVVTSLDQALQGRAAGVQVTPEFRNSGWRYLGQHPWYQLLERQRTALRYRRCSHLRQQHQQQQRAQFHQPCRHRFHGSIERCIGHSHLW